MIYQPLLCLRLPHCLASPNCTAGTITSQMIEHRDPAKQYCQKRF
ncbi:hypothetical protein SO802_028265 [Lithocarpus litseifolius]|uniref:Uncharacterized protein n=1 Tax=Lithocarpus litseifolius TaxID=425828 RepID=A0AAW2BQ21_9ROSI